MSYKRQGSPTGPGGVTTVAVKRPRASDHFESQAASTAFPPPGPPPPPPPPFPAPPTGPAASRGVVAGGGIPKGRRQGVCTHWDLQKAYGFLQDHANGPDSKRVFCHSSSLAWAGDGKQEFASLAIGDEVEFEYIDGERGVEAVKVTAAVQYSERRRGTVTAFNDDKGYGFAADLDPASLGNKEVLVHHKKIKSNARHKTLVVGELIEYGLVSTAKGFAAIDIVQLDPPQTAAASTPRGAAPTAPAASASAAQPDYDSSAYGYQLGQDGQWHPTSSAPTTAEAYYATYGVYPGQSYPPQASAPTAFPTALAPRPPAPEQRPPPAVPAVRPREGPPPVRRPPQQAPPPPPPPQQAPPPPPPQHAPRPPPPPSHYEAQHSPAPYPQPSYSAPPPPPPQRQAWPEAPPRASPPMNSDISWGSRGPPSAQLQRPSYEREPSYSQPPPYNPPATYEQPRPSYEHPPQQQQHYGQPAPSPAHYGGYGEAGGYPQAAHGGPGPPLDAWAAPSSGWGETGGRPSGAYEAPAPNGGGYGQPPPRGGRGEAPWAAAAGGSQDAPRGGRGMGPFAGAGPAEMSILYEGRQVRGGAGEGPFAAYTNGW